MRRTPILLLVVSTLAIAPACRAQQPAEEPGPAMLFAKDQGGLSVAERKAIYESLGLVVDSAGTGFLDTSCGQPAGAEVSFSDLNGDGIKEVLVIFGNSCTSGMTGSSVVLFIKDAAASGYSTNLGFPGASADPQPTSNLGYPDLLIGLPGFCFPIWRWNGTAYDYLKNVPQSPGGCDNR